MVRVSVSCVRLPPVFLNRIIGGRRNKLLETRPLAAHHGHGLERVPQPRLCRCPRRGNPVTLLYLRDHGNWTTGALSKIHLRSLLRSRPARHPGATARQARARIDDPHDSTRYGLSPSSPKTFPAHYRAAISSAIVIVLADATQLRCPVAQFAIDASTYLLAPPAMSFKLAMGLSPFLPAPVRNPPWCERVCERVGFEFPHIRRAQTQSFTVTQAPSP